ncbi:family 2 putative glycosyltransferase [Triangularia verruculosa]|uniref:Family 2 putative glycosyltransferase n=1 Tax=Triangularia verruculosa TaxID=2587418 RepID=A0AAN6XM96_9PEZI|nr:family 2 putative glycosyltransferase [Triangularia verruculosa]
MSNPRRTPPRTRAPEPPKPLDPEPLSSGAPDDLYVPSRLRQNKVFMGLRNVFVLGLCAYGVDQFATWYSDYDNALYWFILLVVWRYARFILNCIGWLLYKPAPLPENPTYTPNRDVTIILPTIDPTGVDFKECISTCAQNEPAAIIVITAGDELLVKTQAAVAEYISVYPKTTFMVGRAMIASKRAQVAVAVPLVRTRITVMLDDHVFWKKNFLRELLAPFEDPEVGLVGTNKKVRRLPDLSIWRRIWNMLGATYLYRHNFEVRSANYWDGGAFVISARTCAMRTRIIADPEYLAGYVDERFFFGFCGPLNPDDDNYNTRFSVRKGWRIKFQYTDDAEIETTVGVADPVHKKFLGQCTRWARTTWRSNPCSLITDGSVWAYQPYCVYAVYLTSFTNFALATDALLFYLYNRAKGANQAGNIILATWIIFVKFVKVFEYYYRHPQDIWTFPAYLLFAYYHSFIKAWALITFYNHAWTGRNLGAIKTQANPMGTEAGNTAGATAVVTNLQRSMSVTSSSTTPSLREEREKLRNPTAWMLTLGDEASRLQKSQTIYHQNMETIIKELKDAGDYMKKTKETQVKLFGQQEKVLKEIERMSREAADIEGQSQLLNSNEAKNQAALSRLRGQLLMLASRHRELIRTAGGDDESPPLSPAATSAFKAATHGTRSQPQIPGQTPPRTSFLTGHVRTPQTQQARGQSGGTGASGSSSATPRAVPNTFNDSFPPLVGESPDLLGKFNIPTVSESTSSRAPNLPGRRNETSPLVSLPPHEPVRFAPPSPNDGDQGQAPEVAPTPKHLAPGEKPSEEFSPVPVPTDSPSGFSPEPKQGTTPSGEPSSSTTPSTARRDAPSSTAESPTRPRGNRKASREQQQDNNT